MPPKRILIANRGEIAVRIQRACRQLGHQAIQVYSEADVSTTAVQMADQSICIGKPPSSKSYLNPIAILTAAKICAADAIHPGYGFLSERADFAKLVTDEGLIFVGPSAESIALMGDKAVARDMAKRAGVPTVPGSDGIVADALEAERIALKIGFPVLLKASAGGGGRGMRVVQDSAFMQQAFNEASIEAENAFGDRSLYVEKYLLDPLHVEVQVLSDGDHVVTLGERDCSTQRRRQKLIEEGPSPAISEALRQDLLSSSRRLAKAIGYRNAGTIEYVVKGNDFYFMEMNTRIQVEHPVTEVLTGIDLVAEQIELAFGKTIDKDAFNIPSIGHVIECRINAENPAENFRPSPGSILDLRFPGGPWVRVDSHCYPGYMVPPFYDSLIAKIVCWGRTRHEAIQRSLCALSETSIGGIETNIEFLINILSCERFRSGGMHTQYVEREVSQLTQWRNLE
jgi:acetyl-CoA carboxylase, biotin carboxylase subunit